MPLQDRAHTLTKGNVEIPVRLNVRLWTAAGNQSILGKNLANTEIPRKLNAH